MPTGDDLDSKIIDYIQYPNEERYLEFKGSVKWEGDIRAKITKSIMALANLKDGGWIVVGKRERGDRTYEITGMRQDDYDSFDSDDIKAFVYSKTEPSVNFIVRKKEHDGLKFVLIEVKEFENIPVICKRDFGDILHSGRIYVRSKGKPESISVPSSDEMREIIDIAIDKGVEKYIQRAGRVGMLARTPTPPIEDDEEAFSREREESF